jgi:uncharacterized membrane protein YbaN (DUF454 family)
VGVDCERSACLVDFDLDSAEPTVMAGIFKESLQEALTRPRRSWWSRIPQWSALVGYRHRGEASFWELSTDARGRLELIHAASARDHGAERSMADRIASLDGVEHCVVSRWPRRVTVTLGPPGLPAVPAALASIEAILEGRYPEDDRLDSAPAGPMAIALVPRWQRPIYLALAGGAFTMTLVGLAVPGIPTVPFLLGTSYLLARSSPGLNERLRRTACFGPVLREWEDQHGLSVSSKVRLIDLSAAIVSVTVILAPLSPVSLGVILLISSLAVYGIARTPAPAPGGGEMSVRLEGMPVLMPAH